MNASLPVDIYLTSPFILLLLFFFPVLSGCGVHSCVYNYIFMCVHACLYMGVHIPVCRPDVDVSNHPPPFFEIIH